MKFLSCTNIMATKIILASRFLNWSICNEMIIETWNGIYPKMTNGESHLILQPEQGVTIINCLSGAGMTLSFGLCEKVVERR